MFLNKTSVFKHFFRRFRRTTEDRFKIPFILFISIYITRILVIPIVHDQALSYRKFEGGFWGIQDFHRKKP